MQARLKHAGRNMLCAALLLVGHGCGGPTVDATAAAARGQQIYQHGTSPSGAELSVSLELFGSAERRFPGSRYACINCHGQDGLVRMEGGVRVPSLQRAVLQAPLRAEGGSGRNRIAYDDALLRRAITLGVDASGNALHPMMPRFNIATPDLDDLLAYLQDLGAHAVPGVDDRSVRIAVVLSEDDPAQAIAAVLRAFVADQNTHGGIYGRKLELAFATPQQWRERPELAGNSLCVLAPQVEAPDSTSALPVVGVLDPDPVLPPTAADHVFSLFPSQATQLRVAVDHWCDTLQHEQAEFVLMAPDDGLAAALEQALQPQVARHPECRLRRIDARTALPPAGAVLLLAGSPGDKQAALEHLRSAPQLAAIYTTHKFAPGVLDQQPAAVRAALRLLLPIPLPDAADPRLREVREFFSRHQIAEDQMPLRLGALTACQVLAEGLKRCGTRVTREKLQHELAGLYRFHPGVFPPISYDGNRRVGARGAQVVRLGERPLQLEPVSEWSEPK